MLLFAAVILFQVIFNSVVNCSCYCCRATLPVNILSECIDAATDYYIYGYSLVMSDITRRQMISNWTMNTFFNALAVPPASWRIITAPNSDTLYSWSYSLTSYSLTHSLTHEGLGVIYQLQCYLNIRMCLMIDILYFLF